LKLGLLIPAIDRDLTASIKNDLKVSVGTFGDDDFLHCRTDLNVLVFSSLNKQTPEVVENPLGGFCLDAVENVGVD
jgi:hypothetical protein